MIDTIALPQYSWSFLLYIERQGFILLFYLRSSCVVAVMSSFVSLFKSIFISNHHYLDNLILWLLLLTHHFCPSDRSALRKKNQDYKLCSKVSQIVSNDNLLSGYWLYSCCKILPFIWVGFSLMKINFCYK